MSRDEDKYLWGDGDVTIVSRQDAAKSVEPKTNDSVPQQTEQQPSEEDE